MQIASITPALADQISAAEDSLRLAMLASDSGALERLLADELLFTNHLGQVLDKAADLAMHRSGKLVFERVDVSQFRLAGTAALPATSSRLHLAGTYDGAAFSADLRFTRVWRRDGEGRWQLAVAHSSAIVA